MSLLMKKKGGRSFAPKLPQKRPAAPTGPSSAQSSARPSIDRLSQTPAPSSKTIETIIIPEEDGTPAPTAQIPRNVENAPPQIVLETPNDPLSNTSRPTEASASSATNHVASSSDAAGLKRKVRDQDAAVEGSSKRHQPSSLDGPNSPHRSASEHSQSQFIQLPTSETSHSEGSVPSSQPSTAAPTLGVNPFEETENDSTPAQVSRPAITSTRRPLPDGTRIETSPSEIIPNGLGPAGDVGSGAEGRQQAQTPVIVPMASLNPDGTPIDPAHQPDTGTEKKVAKRRRVQQGEDGGDVRATVEMQLNRPRRAPGKKSSRKRKEDGRKKSKRAETPEGAEDEEINETEIKLVEICKDLKIGKKFRLHDELRQREKDKITKAQFARLHPELVPEVEEAEAVAGEPREEEVQPGVGIQMRVVNGVIVVAQDSMQLDRHKRAQEEQGDVEEVTENDFSKMTNSGTLMKRERPQLWDMAANEIFWKGLRMFGTDFEMIASMFPHRNRRQIKLKFNKEEKDNPTKVNRILMGANTAIELDTFEELSGMKLEEVQAIDAERDKLDAEQRAEEEELVTAHAEAEKKKKAAIEAQREGRRAAGEDDGGTGEKENHPEGEKTSKKGSKSKKDGNAKKQKKRAAADDETVQVLGDA